MRTVINILMLCCAVAAPFCGGFFADTFGFADSSARYTHFTYIFFHVNIIHYAANALALYKFDEFLALYFERRGCSRSAHYSVSACAVAAAVLASFFCTQPLPTIGLSGITFFYMGFVAAILHNRYTLIYIVVFALFNAIGLATGKMNVLLHAYTFVAGALYAAALLCNFTDKWHRLFKKS